MPSTVWAHGHHNHLLSQKKKKPRYSNLKMSFIVPGILIPEGKKCGENATYNKCCFCGYLLFLYNLSIFPSTFLLPWNAPGFAKQERIASGFLQSNPSDSHTKIIPTLHLSNMKIKKVKRAHETLVIICCSKKHDGNSLDKWQHFVWCCYFMGFL